jgi:hypothetical protein
VVARAARADFENNINLLENNINLLNKRFVDFPCVTVITFISWCFFDIIHWRSASTKGDVSRTHTHTLLCCFVGVSLAAQRVPPNKVGNIFLSFPKEIK